MGDFVKLHTTLKPVSQRTVCLSYTANFVQLKYSSDVCVYNHSFSDSIGMRHIFIGVFEVICVICVINILFINKSCVVVAK